jgi:hypothetical protein
MMSFSNSNSLWMHSMLKSNWLLQWAYMNRFFFFKKKKFSSFAFGRKEYKEASEKWEEWEDGDFGVFLVTWAMIYLPLGCY